MGSQEHPGKSLRFPGDDWIEIPSTLTEDECSSTSTYNYAQDYGLTLDFAKRLAMMTRSERGEQARTYFLNCERIAMEAMAPNVPVLPQTYVQALESLLVTVKEKEELEAAHQAAQEKIVLMEPKAALFDKAMDSADALDMGEVVRVLQLSYGRTTLFQILRDAEILTAKNIPYQRYRELQPPIFRVIENVFTGQDGMTHITSKTLVTQRGIDWLDRRLGELNAR